MKLTSIFVVAMCLPPLAAQAPKSRHFLGVSDALTPANSGAPDSIAQRHLESLAGELSLSRPDLDGTYIAKQYRSEHNGVTHVIFRQRFQGAEVLNAEWVVNIDRDGRILNAGGTLVNAPAGRAVPQPTRALMAVRSAVKAVNPKLADDDFHVIESTLAPRVANGVRFDRGPLPLDVEGKPVWYAINGELRPAWNFFVAATDRVHRYSVTVDDASQDILAQHSLTFFQNASAPAGMVFERESPQPITVPGVRITTPPPVVDRTLQSFKGDPTASPLGWTDGRATAGNNVVVGENLLGTDFIVPTPSLSNNGIFDFPLQLGFGTNPLDYRDAANTNLFYWLNRAHDLHYKYGFDEQAGNFQADNLGKGGTGGDPVYGYTHYGAQALGSGDIENAFFTLKGSADDGVQPEVSMFLSAARGANGDFFTDGSYDAQVMVHEYTHGVSSRLARQAYTTYQGGSMGEAWSDFYGIEYSLPNGGVPDGVYPTGQYFDQSWGAGDVRSRPYSTNMEVNPLTFANLGHVSGGPEVHADGEIWMECLWEMRANLIAQFGEDTGRNHARQLVIDGMKLSIPASTMVDMRDAILLADRVGYKGASQNQIWAAFAKRGMGAVAYSDGGNTSHVVSSFDVPQSGGTLKFYDDPIVAGEPVRLIYSNPDYTQPTIAIQMSTSSGDKETVILHQQGSIYVGSISTRIAAISPNDTILQLVPNDQITATSSDAGGTQAKATLSIMLPYALSSAPPSFPIPTKETRFSASTRVLLPFQFPYFGKAYGTAFVYTSGLIAFDRPVVTSSCTDGTALRKYIGLSPLWLPMTVTGNAQPNEGIFYSTAADGSSVTFRWAGEYTALAQAAVPVNFSTTVYSDGRIDMNYGSGNHIQAASGNICGIPALGLSNGHDVYAATYFNSSYENSAVINFNPPFGAISKPGGTVDAPRPGQHVQDLLTVSGTATDPRVLIRSIDIFIDGVQRARTTPGARGAWSMLLNLPSLGIQPGEHTVQVRVTNNNAATTDLPDPARAFTMDPGQASPAVVGIDKPVAGAMISGTLAVTGYAYNPDLRILSVDTLIDGVSRATTYGVSRTDICGGLSPAPPNCPGVGFSVNIATVENARPTANGQHTLQVRVRDSAGRFTLYPETPLTFTVNNPAAKVVGVLETPTTNATIQGIMTISGYAYSPGHRITSAVIFIDNFGYMPVPVNQSRPDVCASLTEADVCPNIGFKATFDTGALMNGPHLLEIQVTNELGDVLYFPSDNGGGLNFFTQN